MIADFRLVALVLFVALSAGTCSAYNAGKVDAKVERIINSAIAMEVK